MDYVEIQTNTAPLPVQWEHQEVVEDLQEDTESFPSEPEQNKAVDDPQEATLVDQPRTVVQR